MLGRAATRPQAWRFITIVPRLRGGPSYEAPQHDSPYRPVRGSRGGLSGGGSDLAAKTNFPWYPLYKCMSHSLSLLDMGYLSTRVEDHEARLPLFARLPTRPESALSLARPRMTARPLRLRSRPLPPAGCNQRGGRDLTISLPTHVLKSNCPTAKCLRSCQAL